MSEFVFMGTLEDYNIPGIFLSIYLHQFSGSLFLSHHEIEKKIYFAKGIISFAESNVYGDRLGETLLRAGKITQKQYDDSVILLKKTGKRQGTILMQLKYITLPELIKGVRNQLKEIIFGLFSWNQGNFKFMEGNLPINEVVTLKEDTANLVLEGSKKAECMDTIPKGIAMINSVVGVHEKIHTKDSPIRLTPYESKIIQFVSLKSRTIQEICEWSDYDEIETCNFLHFLLKHKIIRIEDQNLLTQQIQPNPD